MIVYKLEFRYCCNWVTRGFFVSKERAEKEVEGISLELSSPLGLENYRITEVKVEG